MRSLLQKCCVLVLCLLAPISLQAQEIDHALSGLDTLIKTAGALAFLLLVFTVLLLVMRKLWMAILQMALGVFLLVFWQVFVGQNGGDFGISAIINGFAIIQLGTGLFVIWLLQSKKQNPDAVEDTSSKDKGMRAIGPVLVLLSAVYSLYTTLVGMGMMYQFVPFENNFLYYLIYSFIPAAMLLLVLLTLFRKQPLGWQLYFGQQMAVFIGMLINLIVAYTQTDQGSFELMWFFVKSMLVPIIIVFLLHLEPVKQHYAISSSAYRNAFIFAAVFLAYNLLLRFVVTVYPS